MLVMQKGCRQRRSVFWLCHGVLRLDSAESSLQGQLGAQADSPLTIFAVIEGVRTNLTDATATEESAAAVNDRKAKEKDVLEVSIFREYYKGIAHQSASSSSSIGAATWCPHAHVTDASPANKAVHGRYRGRGHNL